MKTNNSYIVDYFSIYNKLGEYLRNTRSRKAKCYISIMLIQLRNGLYAMESIHVFKHYLKTRKRIFTVVIPRWRKSIKRSIIIPDELLEANIYGICRDLLDVDEKILFNRYKAWVVNNMGISTRTLYRIYASHTYR